MDWIESVMRIQEAKEKNQLVVFVGSGVSNNSNLPTWSDLIESIAKEVKHTKCVKPCKECDKTKCKQKEKYTQQEFLQIPEYLYVKGKRRYYKFIQDCLNCDNGPNPIDEEIFRILPHHIITTNFDNLLEKCKNVNAQMYSVVAKDSDLLSRTNENYIIKMHGDLQEPEDIVLRESDYIEYEQKRPLISTFIRSLLINHTFVFIGYSLNDYNLKLIMGWINYYSKFYKVKQRPYNFLITNQSTEKNEKRRLEAQQIFPINISRIPKAVVDAAEVPKVLSKNVARKLYTYLRCVTNIELCYRSMNIIKLLQKKYDTLNSYRKISFEDLVNVHSLGHVEFKSKDMLILDHFWFRTISYAIDNNTEICSIFQRAQLSRIRYGYSDTVKIIPHTEKCSDEEFDLCLNCDYSTLDDIIENCSDISKKIYYYCWLNKEEAEIKEMCEQIENNTSYKDYIDVLLSKMRIYYALHSFSEFQIERWNELKFLLYNVPSRFSNSVKYIKSLCESMSDDLRKMDKLLEDQVKRYEVDSNTSYSGHAFSIIWELQAYAYNYYFFFKDNFLPIDKFSDPKTFFKSYIKAILCTYSPATELNTASKAIFATHREHYPINRFDLDIIIKYCEPTSLKQWIKEYSVQSLEIEECSIAKKYSNLCKWCTHRIDNKWLRQLECFTIIISLIKLSDEEKRVIFESIVILCENTFSLNNRYSVEIFEIIYHFVINYRTTENIELYDRFSWQIICSNSSLSIRERFPTKIRALLTNASEIVSNTLKDKVLSHVASITDLMEKINRICIAYLINPSQEFYKVIKNNIDIMEFIDIFQMIIDKFIILTDVIKRRALDEISNSIKSKTNLISSSRSEHCIHLLNYCIIFSLLDLDFDLKLLEKYKDYSDFVRFVLDPDSFDYSKIDFNHYMWQNLVFSPKYQNFFIKHKEEVLSERLKRYFELGIDNRVQQKVVYGIILDKEKELFNF